PQLRACRFTLPRIVLAKGWNCHHCCFHTDSPRTRRCVAAHAYLDSDDATRCRPNLRFRQVSRNHSTRKTTDARKDKRATRCGLRQMVLYLFNLPRAFSREIEGPEAKKRRMPYPLVHRASSFLCHRISRSTASSLH